MPESEQPPVLHEARPARGADRRDFFKLAAAGAAVGFGAAGLAGRASAQTAPAAAPSDTDILNFALNLEYLEAQFYSFAAIGTGIPPALLPGTQTQGAAVGGRKANLQDPVVIQYAREIASDELAHVTTLRRVLGSAAVAQPALDISPQIFTAAAVAAGIDLSASGGVFDPYASDDNFLLAAYIFEDVGVTAYKGAAPLLSSPDNVDGAAGILAAEGFHAGIIRAALYRRGVEVPALWTATDQISALRNRLDGDVSSAGPPQRVANDDSGVSPVQTQFGLTANFVPTDSNGIVFSRNSEQVHNIAYLTQNAATSGGFFPNGTNNPNPALRRSGAN
ncbi:ferritin-like domain-containing protein [Sphingomonas sp.]|jgi:hypothetical protein|uniref:ferritin-like domain-containing protein n=1 Tax=Sphingomonas sp. TaxID=28214 RepID=UPI002639D38A|nr:ferritin-like domain-containing protein [Sphingomonas sp.]MDF2494675.1 ferritin-like protein [Sphingomonas sp.]